MIYDKKDVDAILDYIQKQYGMSSVYHNHCVKLVLTSCLENLDKLSFT